ncbi:MAG: DUF1552 domain-containing protein [Myxococcota bacterium]
MRYRKVLSRRTLLRGAGTIAIGLPFLDEMTSASVYAQPSAPPTRAFTLFFGLGCPWQYAADGYEGALEPLKEFRDRLQIFRGLDLGNGQGFHWDGGAAVFTGAGKRGNSSTRGPSLDFVIREHAYPDGVPGGRLQILNAGYFFRRGEPNPSNTRIRTYRSWDNDGNVTDPPKEYPLDVFRHVFGEGPSMMNNQGEVDPRALARRSILDSVVGDYQSIVSERTGLGAASRSRIRDHLDRVRELEQRFAASANPGGGPTSACAATAPTPRDITGGQARDTGGDRAIRLTFDDWVEIWRQHADVYAMAIKCDMVRFGNLMHQSAGERINLNGDYRYEGRLIHSFDWDLKRNGSHEHFHDWKDSASDREMVGHYLHLTMRELMYFLHQIDGADAIEENGKSIFENMFLIMGTELGDGSGPHDTTRVLHGLGPAGGKFQGGGFNDWSGNGVDLYNTCLKGLGIERFIGDRGFYTGDVPGVLA